MDLLVIGADGADPRLMSYFYNKGKMENLRSILSDNNMEIKPMASRFSGNSVPHTGPAWTTIYTGLTAEEHGVSEDGWTEGKISLSPHFDHTVFAELMDHGVNVGAMTMAITYPAQVTNEQSWMISGYPSSGHKDQVVAPANKENDLPRDFDEIQAKNLFNDEGPKSPDLWRKAEERKVNEILPKFLSGEEDVLFYGTQMTDTMAHRARYRPFPLNGGVQLLVDKLNGLLGTSLQSPRLGTIAWSKEMRISYETLDWIIGTLYKKYKPADLLLVSDHGFQLTGGGHTLLGLSAATAGIERPESILEVKRVILDRFDIEKSSESQIGQIKRPEQELSKSEQGEVTSQLEALGYL